MLLGGARDRGFEAAPFAADITPPLGEPICSGLTPSVASIEHPLLAKGVVLRNAAGICVLCALDSVGLLNSAHETFRQRLAEAAGTTPERVAVQALHLHTAPGLDGDAEKLLRKLTGAPSTGSFEYLEASARRTAAAVRDAATRMQPVTGIAVGWSAVDRVASSRRILQPDGTILARLSATKNPGQQRAPEGEIDAFVRTVALTNGDRALVHLHYYATHPQSFYGDGRVTYDTAGIAREALEKETGVSQVYFTGCAGDIAMGKYNDGTPQAREVLSRRLYEGMLRSVKSLSLQPAGPLAWKSVPVRFAPRSAAGFDDAANRAIVGDARRPAADRIKAAMILGFRGRLAAGRYPDVSCLHLGAVRIFNLPGEPFVEYQLWAQGQRRGLFVCAAGYGDCAPNYICTDRAYSDRGGYEQTWSFVDPSEKLLKGAIASLL